MTKSSVVCRDIPGLPIVRARVGRLPERLAGSRAVGPQSGLASGHRQNHPAFPEASQPQTIGAGQSPSPPSRSMRTRARLRGRRRSAPEPGARPGNPLPEMGALSDESSWVTYTRAICDGVECVPDPCAAADCDAGMFCRDGQCVPSCAQVSCPLFERCADGVCVDDPWAVVTCPPGQLRAVDAEERAQCEGQSPGAPTDDPEAGGDEAAATADQAVAAACNCRFGGPTTPWPWTLALLAGTAARRRRPRRDDARTP